MKDYARELETFMERYINKHPVSFLRDDPLTFTSRHLKIFSVLFFSSEDEVAREGLEEKLLYSLWNNVIDDIIEYTEGGRENILQSFEALVVSEKGEKFIGKTEAGQIMHDLMHRFHALPSGPNKKIAGELLVMDLTRIVNGFDYERIIHENDTMGTLSEYMEFGAVTIDARVLLDIDVSIYPYNMDLSIIGDLREAYKWFGLAFKLSSDIATFEREFFEEISQNAVILLGQEKGLLPKNVLQAELKYKERLFEDIIPSLMNEIKEKAEEYFFRSMKYLEKIDEVNTSHISSAFESMLREYPGPRNFPPPRR